MNTPDQCCPLDDDRDGNCPVHSAPGVLRRSSQRVLHLADRLPTVAGVINVGDTWDASLSKLSTGQRHHLRRVDSDCWVEVRQFDGPQLFELTWERRLHGPYTLIRIRILPAEEPEEPWV